MSDDPQFIGATVEVEFDQPPAFPRRPPCPDRWVWEGRTYHVASVEAEWNDFGRRGRMASNMRPDHLARAGRAGSFGVGRFYFRVRTAEDRVFDLYYDRAAATAGRASPWTLFQAWGEKGRHA
jgi:hypothetical protein